MEKEEAERQVVEKEREGERQTASVGPLPHVRVTQGDMAAQACRAGLLSGLAEGHGQGQLLCRCS